MMNAFYKKLSTGTIFFFIAGIIVAAYYLYTLPENITSSLNIHDVAQINQINSVSNTAAVIIGVELGLGLLAIIFLLIEMQQTVNYTVSANSAKESKNSKSAIATQEETGNSLSEQRLQAIEDSLQGKFPSTKAKFDQVLTEICHDLEASQGVLFLAKQQDQKRVIDVFASYAFYFAESKSLSYEFGEGLAGQVAKEGKLVNINSVPEGYVTILSGLGKSTPSYLIILPISLGNTIVGVLEIASFKEFTKADEDFLTEVCTRLANQLPSQQEHPELVSIE